MSTYRKLMKSDSIPAQLKRYISVLDAQASKAKYSGMTQGIIMPDIVLTKEDCMTATVSCLSEYLSESGVFDFVGENSVLHLKIDNLDDKRNLSFIYDKVGDMLTLAGGFRGDFRGIVCISVRADEHFGGRFIDVMKYIKARTCGCLRVITADIHKEYRINELENALIKAGYIIQTIRSDSLSCDKAVTFASVKLSGYGFELPSGSTNALKIIFSEMIATDKLTALSGVDALCDDLLFYLLEYDYPKVISTEVIDGYFKHCIMCRSRESEKHNIGFAREV